MTFPKIEERTLYPPLVNYLKSIGFEAVGETKVLKKSPDILFQYNSISFVIEVKIGKPEIGLKAVAQASDYAKKLNTQNIIILIYPEKYRNEPITDLNIVDKVALDVNINSLVLTEYWTESLIIKPLNLFKKLKQQIISKKIKVDFKTIVELIGRYVKEFNSIIYKKVEDELFSEVVNKLDLFSSIGDLKDKETAKKQVVNLASYLLFNQLLFYHIYNKKDKKSSLIELDKIEEIKDIQFYFNKITKIDYQSIYRVNILGHIPKSKVVIDTLNEVIKGIKLLRAEHITQDLAGRFFHDLIPFEVRKVLAAFYTHPVAAAILSELTIDSWDETVIDPACGSGTLLVASYLIKQKLYQKLYGFKDNMEMHKQFIESDLTGVDIMPFAAHISAINLTMQNIEQQTNKVRIATINSLELVDSLKSLKFKRSGIEISPYSTSIQLSLDDIYGKPIIIEKKGAVSPAGTGSEFYLKPVDIVIMNPPFSDREKMPLKMREKLRNNPLGDKCGHRINLWGYFLALTDLLLRPNGKFGAVIPFNIARGAATKKIRLFLLENYTIRYIIKPIGDIAFSENSSFMDILFIAEKRKPNKNDKTGIIYLKKSIRDISLHKIDKLITNIKKISENAENNSCDDFDVIFMNSKEILEYKENLMPLIGMFNPNNIKIFENFSKKVILKSGMKLTKLKDFEIREGFHASPAGMSQITFITSPYIKDRVSRAFLIYESEDEKYINVKIKKANVKLKIEKSKVIPALRTLTGIDTFYVDKIDYFIKEEPKDLQKILVQSKWKNKDKFNWSLISKKLMGKKIYIALARRFRPDSSNTHFFAFYNEKGFVSPHTFKILKTDKTESKYLCLFLNSIITLKDIITLREQTTEGFTDIMETELNLFDAFNINNLTVEDKKKLDDCFNYLKNVKFPSILEQLENRFKGRIELDKTILQIIGFNKKDINEWLPRIYDSVLEELKTMKKVK